MRLSDTFDASAEIRHIRHFFPEGENRIYYYDPYTRLSPSAEAARVVSLFRGTYGALNDDMVQPIASMVAGAVDYGEPHANHVSHSVLGAFCYVMPATTFNMNPGIILGIFGDAGIRFGYERLERLFLEFGTVHEVGHAGLTLSYPEKAQSADAERNCDAFAALYMLNKYRDAHDDILKFLKLFARYRKEAFMDDPEAGLYDTTRALSAVTSFKKSSSLPVGTPDVLLSIAQEIAVQAQNPKAFTL